jgi:hypothetical protein
MKRFFGIPPSDGGRKRGDGGKGKEREISDDHLRRTAEDSRSPEPEPPYRPSTAKHKRNFSDASFSPERKRSQLEPSYASNPPIENTRYVDPPDDTRYVDPYYNTHGTRYVDPPDNTLPGGLSYDTQYVDPPDNTLPRDSSLYTLPRDLSGALPSVGSYGTHSSLSGPLSSDASDIDPRRLSRASAGFVGEGRAIYGSDDRHPLSPFGSPRAYASDSDNDPSVYPYYPTVAERTVSPLPLQYEADSIPTPLEPGARWPIQSSMGDAYARRPPYPNMRDQLFVGVPSVEGGSRVKVETYNQIIDVFEKGRLREENIAKALIQILESPQHRHQQICIKYQFNADQIRAATSFYGIQIAENHRSRTPGVGEFAIATLQRVVDGTLTLRQAFNNLDGTFVPAQSARVVREHNKNNPENRVPSGGGAKKGRHLESGKTKVDATTMLIMQDKTRAKRRGEHSRRQITSAPKPRHREQSTSQRQPERSDRELRPRDSRGNPVTYSGPYADPATISAAAYGRGVDATNSYGSGNNSYLDRYASGSGAGGYDVGTSSVNPGGYGPVATSRTFTDGDVNYSRETSQQYYEEEPDYYR